MSPADWGQSGTELANYIFEGYISPRPMRRCAAFWTTIAGDIGWGTDGPTRFRITQVTASASRPHGIKYAFTLHDVDGTRLLGFDNAHGVPRAQAYDHRHHFRRTAELVPYEFRGADELICDFFAAIEQACRQEGVPFEFDVEEVELEMEDDDDTDLPD